MARLLWLVSTTTLRHIQLVYAYNVSDLQRNVIPVETLTLGASGFTGREPHRTALRCGLCTRSVPDAQAAGVDGHHAHAGYG